MERKNKFAAAQALRANDLIGYQDGAVISREIVNTKGGSVTAFAFDKGQGLSEHTAPFDALVHLLDGTADITISGVTHRVHAGELILMPAHEPHALQAITPFKMMLTMIRA